MKANVLALMLASCAAIVAAQDKSAGKLADELTKATQQATRQQLFDLGYQFTPGEVFRWNVEHVSTTKTTLEQVSEVMSSRSQSTVAWKVLAVDSQGQATLEQTIESMNMWQKIGAQPPVSYDSAKDAAPPREFADQAQTIGKPRMSILVDKRGQTITNETDTKQYNFGTGSPWIAFPNQAIAIGHKWYLPNDVVTFNEDKSIKRIKTRICYELAAVDDGTATIRFNTEILTPIDDPNIRSQLLQRITRGTMTFDLARGRTTGKQVNWNEKVQGCRGPNSLLHYLAEYRLSFVDPNAKTPVTSTVNNVKPIKLRTKDDGPTFRR
jgi:hypothetical protein